MNVRDSKVHGANMGPTWARQDPGGPHVGPMDLAIWGVIGFSVKKIDSAGPHWLSTWNLMMSTRDAVLSIEKKSGTFKAVKVSQKFSRTRNCDLCPFCSHYIDVIMGAIPSQITTFTIVYSTVYSGADQRKHQSSASLAFVRGIHREPVNSPHKWPVTRKMFLFDEVIMIIWLIVAMSPFQFV